MPERREQEPQLSFKEKTSQALTTVFSDEKYKNVRNRFRRWYVRSLSNNSPQNPEEKRSRLINGIGYAIYLHDFIRPTSEEVTYDDQAAVQSYKFSRRYPDLLFPFPLQTNASFDQELLASVPEVFQDHRWLAGFEQSVRESGVDTKTVTREMLEQEIVKGFTSHYMIEGRQPIEGLHIRRLQQTIMSAFGSLLKDPTYKSLLESFRYTFEFKKTFPWREESGNDKNPSKQNGLANAFEFVLRNGWFEYLVTSYGTTALTDAWKEEMLASMDKASRDILNLNWFFNTEAQTGGLKFENVTEGIDDSGRPIVSFRPSAIPEDDHPRISSDELGEEKVKQLLVRGLSKYVSDHEVGNSGSI